MVSWSQVGPALAFIGLSAIWGSAFLFVKWVAPQIPPFTVVAMRLLSASTLMWLYVLIRVAVDTEYRRKSAETIKCDFFWKVFILGLLNNAIPFSLVCWGEQYVGVGIASILDSTIPLFSQILGHFLLPGERLNIKRVAGLVIGFCGVTVVCIPSLIPGADGGDGLNATFIPENQTSLSDAPKPEPITVDGWTQLGYSMMIIGASASYGCASVWSKRMMKDEWNNQLIATGQISSGALIVTTIALAWEYNVQWGDDPSTIHFGFFKDVDMYGYIAIGYLGVISTVIAYVLYFYLLDTVGAVRQTMVGFMLPVFGVFEGALIAGDWEYVGVLFKILEVLGAVLVILGVGLVTLNFGDLKKSLPCFKNQREQNGYAEIEDGVEAKDHANAQYSPHINGSEGNSYRTVYAETMSPAEPEAHEWHVNERSKLIN